MTRILDKVKLVGPGILVAATGVGAGDLATGALTGSLLGVAILWAVIVGALFKYAMNEGLTRWQLATETTLLEGCFRYFGTIFLLAFLAYLILWTYFVSAALMSACGVVMHAILPVFGSPENDKWYWGILHSLVAVGLVFTGGYRLFEKVMTVCIGVMFVTVVLTAVAMQPNLLDVLSGIFWPTIPHAEGQGTNWTIALLGGIGGTLTILCYGYWIREEGRVSLKDLPTCRIDLASGYLMTAIFGMAMVVIGSEIVIEKGASSKTIVVIAEKLQEVFGNFGKPMKWVFLVGAWGAVASSLLGVWQSVPYLFADVYESLTAKFCKRDCQPVNVQSWPYRLYLIAMAFIPILALSTNFKSLQKIYAICGALLIPLLAVVLLILGNSSRMIGRENRNPLWSNALLGVALLFFSVAGLLALAEVFRVEPMTVK